MLSAAWVLYALVTGTFVAVACAAADHAMRRHARATRWLWIAGLGAMTLLAARGAVAALSAEPPGTASTAAMNASPVTGTQTVHGPLALAHRTLDASRALVLHAMLRATRALPTRLGRLLAALWMLATTTALLRIARVHRRVARLRRGWPVATLFGHSVRIAPDVGPAVLGTVRAFIVVPRWLLARHQEEQRLVVAHEVEHLRAHDTLLLAFASVAVALMPWHPASWWLRARLRLAIELDCDARVLQQGVAARTYGELLIDLAGQCSSLRLGATALAEESSQLERRLLAMTPRTSRTTRTRTAALVAAGALALLAACEAKAPTAADVQNMNAAGAERSARSLRLIDAGSPGRITYYVNGVPTEAATAHAIAPNRIASLEVKKTGDASEVRITMRGADSASGGIRFRDGPAPLVGMYFVDGVRSSAAAVQALDPTTITGVEVIKGPAAIALSSDPAAVNGIIRVTTKAGSLSK